MAKSPTTIICLAGKAEWLLKPSSKCSLQIWANTSMAESRGHLIIPQPDKVTPTAKQKSVIPK